VVTAVILAVIAVVLVIIGIIYLAEPSSSLPSVIPGHLAGSAKHHPLRGGGCLVLGVIFFVAAWFALSFQPKAAAPAADQQNLPAPRH
jgi:amino acid permease